MELKDKVVVITGAAGGIAHGLMNACCEEGVKGVVLADIQKDDMEANAQEMRDKFGTQIVTVVGDLAVEENFKKVAQAALDTFGQVDVLFNNAGIGFNKSFSLLTDNDWKFMLRSNLWTIIYGMRTFLPILRANENGGNIVNIASGAGILGSPSMSHYSTVKFGILGMTETVIEEERILYGGKVNLMVVMPCYIQSNLMTNYKKIRPAELQNEFEEQTPLDIATENEMTKALEYVDPPTYNDGGFGYSITNIEGGRRIIADLKADKNFCFPHPEWAGLAAQMGQVIQSGYMPPMFSAAAQ